MSYTSIKDWPEDERPRERLLKHGHEHMSDAHLIAIILRTGGCGRSAVDIGMEMLRHFGSLKKIEQASTPRNLLDQGAGQGKDRPTQGRP
jgi:DNA repair protein RadC